MLKIKEYQNKLIDGVKTVLESRSFKEVMEFSTRFRKYSFNNTILIWLKYPQASRVAGIKTWNEIGRHVKKGEKGIAIFAPLLKKTKEEKEEVRLIGFRAVYVWDVEQTEGEPMPEVDIAPPVMDGDPEKLFQKVLLSSPVPVSYEEIKGKAKGYYLIKEKWIVLPNNLTPEQRTKTLLHELAHHVYITDSKEWEKSKKDLPAAEIIAEGAAYMASARFGLDSASYSFPYIATWAKDAEKVLTTGNVMRNVATELIEMVEANS